MFYQPFSKFNLLSVKALVDTMNNILKLSKINALLLLLKTLAYRDTVLYIYISINNIIMHYYFHTASIKHS